MPQELVSAALAQAERAAPIVKAPALLHAARVLNAFDPQDAQRVLERGLALADALPEPERAVILAEAVPLAAAVSPTRALSLASSVADDGPRSALGRALDEMISHGHLAAAVDYLSAPTSARGYPFDAAMHAMGRSKDETMRLRILRGAIAALERELEADDPARLRRSFALRLVTAWWRLLPADEAAAIVRRMVQSILGQPDGWIRAAVQDVRFSSTREHALFQVLGPLRHLDPMFARSLIDSHSQLAAAAHRYPYGEESIAAEASERARQPPPSPHVEQPPCMFIGNRLLPIPEALATGFKQPFDLALRAYSADTDPERPNDAPQECWPSTQDFRNILYNAGRHEGRAAVKYLERIPDPIIRMFAQIELAAALVRLPQIGGSSITPGPRGFHGTRGMAPRSTDRHAPVPALHSPAPLRKPDLPASLSARIAPTRRPSADRPAGGSGPDYWVIEGAPLRPFLAHLYDIPPARIDISADLEARAFDFALVLPEPVPRAEMIRLMRDGIERHFRVTRETRSVEAQVFTAPNGIRAREANDEASGLGFASVSYGEIAGGAPPRVPLDAQLADMMNLHMAPDDPESPDDASRLMNKMLRAAVPAGAVINGVDDSMTMAELCRLIENALGQPVVDETGLSGTYAIRVHAEVFSTRDFLKVVCDTLGLAVTAAPRDIGIIVVRP